ncbi:hypothetical protein B7494_g666 [Chlorociboria aeruginascens]|nr:hypothetical protein B7494_g666 [Chlorociboria aeruginascens]
MTSANDLGDFLWDFPTNINQNVLRMPGTGPPPPDYRHIEAHYETGIDLPMALNSKTLQPTDSQDHVSYNVAGHIVEPIASIADKLRQSSYNEVASASVDTGATSQKYPHGMESSVVEQSLPDLTVQGLDGIPLLPGLATTPQNYGLESYGTEFKNLPSPWPRPTTQQIMSPATLSTQMPTTSEYELMMPNATDSQQFSTPIFDVWGMGQQQFTSRQEGHKPYSNIQGDAFDVWSELNHYTKQAHDYKVNNLSNELYLANLHSPNHPPSHADQSTTSPFNSITSQTQFDVNPENFPPIYTYNMQGNMVSKNLNLSTPFVEALGEVFNKPNEMSLDGSFRDDQHLNSETDSSNPSSEMGSLDTVRHKPRPAHISTRVSKRKQKKQTKIQDKEKTLAVRNMRACTECRRQKTACDTVDGCWYCLKLAHGDVFLAQRLCFRDVEKVMHARNNIIVEVRDCIDFESIMSSGIRSVDAPTGEGLMALAEVRLRAMGVPPLSVYDKNDSMTLGERLCLVHKRMESYRITSESLPTPKRLVEWGIYDIPEKARLFPNDVESIIDAIFLSYVNHKPTLPFCNLIKHILGITILSRYLDSRRPVDYDRLQAVKGEDVSIMNWRFVASISNAARKQIFLQAIKAITKNEKYVLGELDRLVSSRNQIGYDPVVLGLCVRRLSLYYRHIMARYKALGKDVAQRYQNGRIMYESTVRQYARTYKGTLSPFHEDWDGEMHQNAFDHDEDLISKFEQLKIAEKHHYENELTLEDDGVYRCLFVERKDRKGNSVKKSWSKG